MRLSVLLIFVFSVASLFAQDKYLSDDAGMENLCVKVAQLFADNEISDAFKELKPYWPLPENEMESLETKTIKYMNLISNTYDTVLGITKANEETIADIAIRKTYLVRYDYTAIRLIFTYYLGKEGWLLNAFKWDDSFDEEFR